MLPIFFRMKYPKFQKKFSKLFSNVKDDEDECLRVDEDDQDEDEDNDWDEDEDNDQDEDDDEDEGHEVHRVCRGIRWLCQAL